MKHLKYFEKKEEKLYHEITGIEYEINIANRNIINIYDNYSRVGKMLHRNSDGAEGIDHMKIKKMFPNIPFYREYLRDNKANMINFGTRDNEYKLILKFKKPSFEIKLIALKDEYFIIEIFSDKLYLRYYMIDGYDGLKQFFLDMNIILELYLD